MVTPKPVSSLKESEFEPFTLAGTCKLPRRNSIGSRMPIVFVGDSAAGMESGAISIASVNAAAPERRLMATKRTQVASTLKLWTCLRRQNPAPCSRPVESEIHPMTEPTITPELPAKRSLMPHPERACEPLLGSDDGKWIFESIFTALKKTNVAACV